MSQGISTGLGLRAGTRLGNGRYRVLDEAWAEGELLVQHCLVETLHVTGRQDEQLIVLLKSIHYGRRLPAEPLPPYVGRRRLELRREAANLAHLKRLTNHLPQIVDLLSVTNDWSHGLGSAGLQADEPLLLLEELKAQPLSVLQAHHLTQEEVLELAERLLMLLRVFHIGAATGKGQYFFQLTPPDILLDRDTRTSWFQGLGKLRSPDELKARIHCAPEELGFVSPALANHLVPAAAGGAPPPKGVSAAATDLFSLGACLLFALVPDEDFSDRPIGWLTRDVVRTLAQARGLAPHVEEFLAELVNHGHRTAHDALNRLHALRKRGAPATFQPPEVPQDRPFDQTAKLPLHVPIAGRYEPIAGLSAGGQGCVYLAVDRGTQCHVVLKIPRHTPESLAPLALASEVPARREALRSEARRALLARQRTGSVPQLLDLVFTESPEPVLMNHQDPAIRGPREPVLVFEYVAGHPLSTMRTWSERSLLQLACAICHLLARLHATDAAGRHLLYIDWKPENILWHPETDGYTLLDLGSVVVVEGGRFADDLIARTLPYAALEEFLPGPVEVLNQNLTPGFDLYGLGAVLWRLAVRPDDDTWVKILGRREALAQQGKTGVVFDPDALPAEYANLKPILARAIEPDPANRTASAREMLTEIYAALGRLSELPPEPPRTLQCGPLPGHAVGVTCQLAADPFVRKVVILRGDVPIHETSVSPLTPSVSIQCTDRPPAALLEVDYAAYTEGCNGQRSRLRTFRVQMVVDPVPATPERLERAIRLRWRVPEIVRDNQGQIVVDCLTGGVRQVYAGDGEECMDSALDPAVEYEYRIYSRLPHASSDGVRLRVRPLPVLARVRDMTTEPGDRRVTVRFSLSPGAADAFQIVRTDTQLTPVDLDAHLRGAAESWIPLQMDSGYCVTGLMAGARGDLAPAAGSLEGSWEDPRRSRAGETHWYTLVLRYRDGDQQWHGPSVSAVPYAEAERVVALPMPAGVRLQWNVPPGVDSVEIVRNGTPLPLLPAACTAFLDQPLEPGQLAEYLILLHTGTVSGRGIKVSCTAGARAPRARMRAVAGPDRGELLVDSTGLSQNARVVVRSVSGKNELALPGNAHDGMRSIRVPLTPWEDAELVLEDAGAEIERTRMVQLAEVGRVGLGRAPDGDLVAWRSPPGVPHLALLDRSPAVRILPGTAKNCRLGHVEPGSCQALIHALSPAGEVSSGRIASEQKTGAEA